MTWNAEAALNDFMIVARLAGIEVTGEDIQIETNPAPHAAPVTLPSGFMAIYVFSRGDEILKVGNVGPNSQARYTSQHYNPCSAISTLAGSLLADRSRLGIAGIEDGKIGEWIKSNMDRVNILMSARLGVRVLTLLEAFLQCRLRPTYEGFKSQKS